jgi:hypothetical protein
MSYDLALPDRTGQLTVDRTGEQDNVCRAREDHKNDKFRLTLSDFPHVAEDFICDTVLASNSYSLPEKDVAGSYNGLILRL